MAKGNETAHSVIAMESKLVGLHVVERPVSHDEITDLLRIEIGEICCADVCVHTVQVLGLDHIE